MNKFVLLNNKVFHDGTGYVKIHTDGVRWHTDAELPMYFNHNYNILLGTFADLQMVEDTEGVVNLEVLSNFDEDEEALKYQHKVDKGTINFCSAGLLVTDGYSEDGVFNIKESFLFEGSLTPIPANRDALKLFGMPQLLVSDDTKLDGTYELDNTVTFNNSDYKVLKLNSNNIIKEEDIMDNKLKKEVEDLKIQLTQKSKEIAQFSEELKAKDEELKAKDEELKAKDEAIEDEDEDSKTKDGEDSKTKDEEIETLTKELNSLKEELALLKSEIAASMEEKAKEEEDAKFNLITDAQTKGLITKEGAAIYKKFSLEEVTDLINSIKPSAKKITDVMNFTNDSNEIKSFSWYLKNNKEELNQIQKSNPELFNKILNK